MKNKNKKRNRKKPVYNSELFLMEVIIAVCVLLMAFSVFSLWFYGMYCFYYLND